MLEGYMNKVDGILIVASNIQLTINVWSSLDTSLSRTGDFENLQQLMLL